MTEMLGRMSLQDGKRGVQEGILIPHHLGYQTTSSHPALGTAALCLLPLQPRVNTLPCKETLLSLRDACR